VFGLGQARPRSEEFGVLVEAVLSFDRGARDGLGAGGAGSVLPVDISPVAVVASTDEGVCVGAVRSKTPDGLFAVAGDALASDGEASLVSPFLFSGLAASLADAQSTRCGAD
jgi:hypothetical protein